MSSASERLVESLQQKKAAESLAVQWVERLIEPATPKSLLKEAVQFIEPRHYNDVIEERFIDKLCGWPLCNHTLPDTPLPKYRVSMSQRTVVDLTERNKFCSADCYRSSNFIASQIPSAPVWSRNNLAKVQLKFLNETKTSDSSTCANEEHPVPTSDDKLKKLLQDSIQTTTKQTSTDNVQDVKIVERMELVKLQDYSSDSDDEVSADQQQSLVSSQEPISPLVCTTKEKIGRALEYWCTSRTREWLKVYLESSIEPDEGSTKGKTLNKASGETEKGDDYRNVLLPPVHGSEVSQIQRSIFMQQMRSSITQVVSLLGLSVHNVLPDITGLVKTFRLSSSNIMFKPTEWKLIICILLSSLKIIDLKDSKDLKNWLDTNSLTLTDFIHFTRIIQC